MPIILDIVEEGPPKRLIIEMAFSEIGSAGYEFGRTPEEVADALQRLNALMAEWLTLRGIDLGYDQPHYGIGNPDDLSGIPFHTLNTVASALALKICPMMGAGLSVEARANLIRSLAALEAAYASISPMPLAPNTPRGAGAEHQLGTQARPFVNETVIEGE